MWVRTVIDDRTSRSRRQAENFAPKVTVLIENVQHHVKEEEKELFPKVRKAMTRSELADLV